MATDEKRPGAYAQGVTEEVRLCIADLRQENDALRALVSVLRDDKRRLVDATAAADRRPVDDLTQLRTNLADAQREIARQQELILGLLKDADRYKRIQEDLETHLSQVEADNERFSSHFVNLEKRATALASLYVASYRLNETLDHQELLAIIKDIVVNIIGSEELAVFEVEPASPTLRLVMSSGMDPEPFKAIALGEGPVGRTAVSGELFLAPAETADRLPETTPLVCVPLRHGKHVSGVVALFGLLPQKHGFTQVDQELFELLATHAGLALYCSKLHARSSSLGECA